MVMAYVYFLLAGFNVALALRADNPAVYFNAGLAVAMFGYGLVETFKKGR